MKFAFFGSPEFAAIILEKLIVSGMPPSVVICNPDKPRGRKKVLTPPAVKTKIMNYESGIREKIKILQPEKLEIRNLKLGIGKIDFAVVAAYSKILPKEILEIPRLGTIGIHPSLLPKYRGATPIQTAILGGEEKTGAALFLIDEKIDHGPILTKQVLNKELSIMNYETALKSLAELSGDLLVEILPKFLAGEIKSEKQDESQATYTKKFKIEDGFIDFGKDAPEFIERKIRALNPEPGVFTFVANKAIPLIRANKGYIENPSVANGGHEKMLRMKILAGEIANGKLRLKKIQFEGKKPVYL